MTKVLILGSTGMLGSAVGKIFEESEEFETILTYRNEEVSYGKNKIFFDVLNSPLSDLPSFDYLINCVGVIKPFIEKNRKDSVYINSLFPYLLAEQCEKNNARMIHITTDCVFSGKTGNYDEDSEHDCLDFYGKSKSLGEPFNKCMVIRTSIIGEEIHNNASLIEWAKSMKGKSVNGFTDHKWNGVTTKQYGKICKKIIKQDLYEKGLFHAHSDSVDKYELVSMISDKFELGLDIKPVASGNFCDRTLSTKKTLNKKLEVPSLSQQIKEL
jgi:dTDP-4-dehydrorhamnose reductase